MRIMAAALLLLPAAALANSAFDGTWKQNMQSTRVMGRPEVLVLIDGEYTCSSCDPELKVKADGAVHKVSGHAYYDAVSVRIVSPTAVESTLMQGGKVIARLTETVSADGKTLTTKFTNHGGQKVISGETTAMRVASGPSGAHAISGSWQQQQVQGNDTLRTMQMQMTADGFNWHQNGQSYDAKFDGKEYPVVGDPGHTSVTLRKIDANTVEEIDHRQGKVVDEIQLEAAQDGKTVEVTDRDLAHGQTTTFTLDKQP
jgi:uncharacterized lipoprotein YmbA